MTSLRGRLRTPGTLAAVLLIAGVWAVGLLALAGVLSLHDRSDHQHDGQVKVEQLGNRLAVLPSIGFSPSIGQDVPVPVARKRMLGANQAVDDLVDRISRHEDAAAERRLRAVVRRYQDLNTTIIPLAAGGEADELFGRARAPGGAIANLDRHLARLSAKHDRDAERAKGLADAGAVVAILFLLVAFTLTMVGVLRSKRRALVLADENARLHEASLRDSLTDSLTQLPNRRAMFERYGEERLAGAGPLRVGILDLDGFKLFNDTFGHPAGDVLLRRLAGQLQAALNGDGTAYRMGGDEFCVISEQPGGDTMARAQAAMSEQGKGVSVRCSIGVVSVPDEASTLDEALHVADIRLYADKYSHRLNKRSRTPAPQSAK